MKKKAEKKEKTAERFLSSSLFVKDKNKIICGNCDLVSNILNTIDALIVVLDAKGRIVFFNRACEKVTGYNFSEVNEKYVWEFLLPPEDMEPVKKVFDDLATGKLTTKHENYWVAKNGRRRMIAWSNSALADPTGKINYIIGTGLDITEHKKAEDKISAHSEELERLNRLMIGRELKMMELKKELEEFKKISNF